MKKKKLSCVQHLYAEPLLGKQESSFAWGLDVAARNAIGVRERVLDGAFLTPIDYARDSSLLYIAPNVAVSSLQGDGTITLHFRENLHSITTLAVDPSSSSEIVLARIVLAEQFDLRPSLVPFSGDLKAGLDRADAVLCVGDASIREWHRDRSVLDVVEEWMELTGFPYVHGFWCGRERSLGGDDVGALRQACADGLGMLEQTAARAGEVHRLTAVAPVELQQYLEQLSYEFMSEEQSGVQEFFRYAFYHGILPDIAELQFYTESARGEDERVEGEGEAPPEVH
jgi:predicted solute-binding protein